MADSLFVVTNRDFARRKDDADFHVLKDGPNRKGDKELRLFEATPRAAGLERWNLALIPDRPAREAFAGLDDSFVTPANRRRFGSDLVAANLLGRLRNTKRNLLFFIHGYNNNVDDALRRAAGISAAYDVEVVVFSWPANGGGNRLVEDIHGTASYLSDKSDARSSTGALDRALARMQGLLGDMNAGVLAAAQERAVEAAPGNREEQRRLIARELRAHSCPFNMTLLAHSMGNYVYKKVLMASEERLSRHSVFDNVILKAADTNHENHREWVERVRTRRRVYVCINQDDDALKLSSLKIGEAQKARLGSTLAQQDAGNAAYIDLTGLIRDEHSYFVNTDVGRHVPELEAFFRKAVNGEIAHRDLPYFPDTNTYRLK